MLVMGARRRRGDEKANRVFTMSGGGPRDLAIATGERTQKVRCVGNEARALLMQPHGEVRARARMALMGRRLAGDGERWRGKRRNAAFMRGRFAKFESAGPSASALD